MNMERPKKPKGLARLAQMLYAGAKYGEYVGHTVEDKRLGIEQRASEMFGGVHDLIGRKVWEFKARLDAGKFEKLMRTPRKVEKKRGQVEKKVVRLRQEIRGDREMKRVWQEEMLAELRAINEGLTNNLLINKHNEAVARSGPNHEKTERVDLLPDPNKNLFAYGDEDAHDHFKVGVHAGETVGSLADAAQALSRTLGNFIHEMKRELAPVHLQDGPHFFQTKKVEMAVSKEEQEALVELVALRKRVRNLHLMAEVFASNVEVSGRWIDEAETAATKEARSRTLPENVALDYQAALQEWERLHTNLDAILLRRLRVKRRMRETRATVTELLAGRTARNERAQREEEGRQDLEQAFEHLLDLSKRYATPDNLRRAIEEVEATPGSVLEKLGKQPTLHDLEEGIVSTSLPQNLRNALSQEIRARYLQFGAGNTVHRAQLAQVRYSPVPPSFIRTLLAIVQNAARKPLAEEAAEALESA